jgi:hypothetical protein
VIEPGTLWGHAGPCWVAPKISDGTKVMANIVNYHLPNPLFTVYIQTIFKIYLLIFIVFNAFPHEGATIEFQKWSLHGPPIHSNSSELEDHLLVGSCSTMRAQ